MAENVQHKLLQLLLGTSESEEIATLKRALVQAIEKSQIPLAPVPIDPQAHALSLMEFYQRLQEQHEFKPGQLVRWKKGLRHRLIPQVDQPGIVLEVLPKPITDGIADAFNIGFREPLDIKIGILAVDNNMISYFFDSRRFEPM